jgi:hypothetical protein
MSAERTIHSSEVTGQIDKLPSPERPRLRLIKTVALPGPSNSGKDALARILHERHGWPVYDGTSTGFKRRKNSPDQGPIKRSHDAHKEFDKKQGRAFDKLSVNDIHQLHQTRLSGIILAERRDERSREIGRAIRRNEWLRQQGRNPIPLPADIPAISVLLWARKEVRVERAFEQALAKWQEQQARIAAGEVVEKHKVLPKPTKSAIEDHIEFRDRQDVLDWAPLHPKYIKPGDNPFNRMLKRPNGGPVYDAFLDNSELTLEETADAFEDILISFGAAEAIEDPEPRNQEPNRHPYDGEPMAYGGEHISVAGNLEPDVPLVVPSFQRNFHLTGPSESM